YKGDRSRWALEGVAAVERADHEDRQLPRPRVDAVPKDVDDAIAVGVDLAILATADDDVVDRSGQLPRPPGITAITRDDELGRLRECIRGLVLTAAGRIAGGGVG